MNGADHPAASLPIESLLADNAWFARLAAAVATNDADGHRAAPPWAPVASEAEGVERAELRLTLLDAVRALDEPYRTAIVLRCLEGRDLGAIARITGASESIVRDRVEQGLARLRAGLRGLERES